MYINRNIINKLHPPFIHNHSASRPSAMKRMPMIREQGYMIMVGIRSLGQRRLLADLSSHVKKMKRLWIEFQHQRE